MFKSATGLWRTQVPNVIVPGGLEADINFDIWKIAASKLFRSKAVYVHPSKFDYKLPERGVPEVAFVGRSNVGKSSLIDNLLGGSKLVKISKAPGCTKSVNFFALSNPKNENEHFAYFVDLPGYGFARAAKSEQKSWPVIINSYIGVREPTVLRRVFVLIDSRHGIMENDVEMLNRLNKMKVPYQVVFTKCDKPSKTELMESLDISMSILLQQQSTSCIPLVHTVSSKTNLGMDTFKLALMQALS